MCTARIRVLLVLMISEAIQSERSDSEIFIFIGFLSSSYRLNVRRWDGEDFIFAAGALRLVPIIHSYCC